MAASLVSNTININSHKGEYVVSFISSNMTKLNSKSNDDNFYIVDNNIAEIYRDQLSNILNSNRVLLIEATEKIVKSIEEYKANIAEDVVLGKLDVREFADSLSR